MVPREHRVEQELLVPVMAFHLDRCLVQEANGSLTILIQLIRESASHIMAHVHNAMWVVPNWLELSAFCVTECCSSLGCPVDRHAYSLCDGLHRAHTLILPFVYIPSCTSSAMLLWFQRSEHEAYAYVVPAYSSSTDDGTTRWYFFYL